MSQLHFHLSRRAIIVTAVLSLLRQASALDIEYCSSLNTASSGPAYWQYQSNGWCHDHCVGSFAFAIVQGYNCWCSDYAPGVTSSSSDCNTPCPGYDELCGGSGVYGYIALDQSPSGTMGASSSPMQQVTVTASVAPVTIFSTVTPTSSQDFSTSSTLFSSTPDSAGNPPSSTTSMSWVPTPLTTVLTTTGVVMIVTITPTVPPTTAASGSDIEATSDSHGLNTGQAVGLTVGLVVLVAIIGAIIFFCVRRRRQTAGEPFDDIIREDSSSGQVPKRTMSENSRYMLGTDGRQVVEGWEQDSNTASSRRSRLMPVDPRLDPFAPVYQRGDGNKSRDSVATIRDDHDYSRRVHQGGRILRATNPDE